MFSVLALVGGRAVVMVMLIPFFDFFSAASQGASVTGVLTTFDFLAAASSGPKRPTIASVLMSHDNAS
jgi:hypothetical protein